jgi:hypothetical protein
MPPASLIGYYGRYCRQVWPFVVAMMAISLTVALIEVTILRFVGAIVDILRATPPLNRRPETAPETDDKEPLEVSLRGQSPEGEAAIAARTALRVAPLIFRDVRNARTAEDVSAFLVLASAVFRASALARVAGEHHDLDRRRGRQHARQCAEADIVGRAVAAHADDGRQQAHLLGREINLPLEEETEYQVGSPCPQTGGFYEH